MYLYIISYGAHNVQCVAYNLKGSSNISYRFTNPNNVRITADPTHPNPNVVRICKSVWNIVRSLNQVTV